MPVWHTFKCPKSQGSPSGFYKGLVVGYTAALRVTQSMTQQPTRRACRKALESLLEAGGPVPSYQHNSAQWNALPCLPLPTA